MKRFAEQLHTIPDKNLEGKMLILESPEKNYYQDFEETRASIEIY